MGDVTQRLICAVGLPADGLFGSDCPPTQDLIPLLRIDGHFRRWGFTRGSEPLGVWLALFSSPFSLSFSLLLGCCELSRRLGRTTFLLGPLPYLKSRNNGARRLWVATFEDVSQTRTSSLWLFLSAPVRWEAIDWPCGAWVAEIRP